MRTFKQMVLSIAAVCLTLTIVNCGGGGSSGSSAKAAVAYGMSCGTNMLSSQYGCLPQCGQMNVIYNNQCVPITNAGYYPGSQYGQYGNQYGYGGTGNTQICQGACPPGSVSVNGGQACLQQGSCGPCYGYYSGSCYQGDYAHQYYGY